MFKIKYFILLLFFSRAITAQESKSDWQKEDLKGKVKSVLEITYKIRKNEIEEFSKLKKIYNSEGFKIEEHWYEIETGLVSKEIYTYDTQNNIIEKKEYNYEGNMDRRRTFLYNEKGNIIEENLYKRGNLIEYTIIYDEKGNNIEEKNYNPDGSLSTRQVSIYDENGKFVEGKQYNADGIFIGNFIYGHLDDSGINWISQLPYTYKYDEWGNWIEKILYCKKKPCYIYKRNIEYYK